MKGMYFADGTQILEHKYSEIISSSDLGIFRLTTSNGEKEIYVPGCGVWSLGDMTVSGSLIKDYNGNYMVISTGEVLHLENAREVLGTSLVSCDQGVIDTYTGTILIGPDYDFVVATEDHLYVRRGDTWYVYQYELVTE